MNRYQVRVSNIDGWLIELHVDAEGPIDALIAASKLYADDDDARGFHGTVQRELFNLSDPPLVIDRR